LNQFGSKRARDLDFGPEIFTFCRLRNVNYLNLFQLDRSQPQFNSPPAKRKRSVDYWISLAGGCLLGLGVALTAYFLYMDSQVHPRLAFEKSDWRVTFNLTSGCELDGKAKPECPANADYKALWESPVHRESAQFLDRFASSKSEAFWMGLKIAPEKLKLASKASAPVLVLPKMNGTVQVWIDGVYQATHDFSQESAPLQFPLPKSRLLENRELVVALGVFPYPHQPVPESKAESSEGFFTTLDADRLTRSSIFFSTSIHLIAVGLFLLVAGFLWSVSATGRTRDYAVGTQLALVISLISLMSVDLSFRVFNVATYESIYFALLIVEAVLIARFTWTVLQGSRGTSRLEVGSIFACLMIPIVFNFSNWIEVTGVNLMTSWILPLTYLVCAGAVGVRFVKISKTGSVASRTRRQFIAVTGFATALTAIAYFIESHNQSGFHVVWSRWINFVILFGLVRVFTKSHQTKSSLIELSPSSSYHRLETVPDRVEGWLLRLDVAKFSTDRQVMSTVLSHLWTISKLNDGEVIKAEEGSLLVLFGTNEDHNEDERVMKTLAEMSKCVIDLEQRLPIVIPSQSHTALIFFRAAIAKGALKPTFHHGETGSSRIPMWLDVDSHNTMQATKELLAADLTVKPGLSESSVVLMKTADANLLVQGGILPSDSAIALDKQNVTVFVANEFASYKARHDLIKMKAHA
jgi:hypothetical protein